MSAPRKTEPLLGLVMIAKNDAEAITRCLESVRPYIDTWTICDTGSTDDTETRVKDALAGIPGSFRRHKWGNFGHNLTLAHRAAKGRSRWLLWLHADMTVTSDDPEAFLKWLRRRGKKLDALRVEVQDSVRKYRLPLIMRGDIDWRYVGATHEYLERADGRPTISQSLTGFLVGHHADGANRPDKYERDLALMKQGVLDGNPRDTFYTAETYRFAGETEKAIHFYRMRLALNGFEEERWYSAYQIAVLSGSFEALIRVWGERPWRHEPLTAAARLVAEMNPDAGGDGLFLEPAP